MHPMNSMEPLHDNAAELIKAAQAFHSAACQPGILGAAPLSLARTEEALQLLSGAWYQLAAHASPGIPARRHEGRLDASAWPRVGGVSREQEVLLIGTLHDVAAAFARCARECRDGRSDVTPLIAMRVAAGDGGKQSDQAEVAWFETRERPTERVA